MLHCPPSRINLTNTDVADFERRSAIKQEASKLAQVKPAVPRLSAGPSRLAGLHIVPADDNAARKTTICSNAPGRGERIDPVFQGTTLPLPTIQTSDYDGNEVFPGRRSSDLNSVIRTSPGLRLQRRDGSIPVRHGSLVPPALDGIDERRLRPVTTYQTSGQPRPTNLMPRSARQSLQRSNFVLYEDSSSTQAYIEAQHLGLWHGRPPPNGSGHFLRPNNHVATRLSPSSPVLATTRRPSLSPNLNPGAPAFVPRTRFGSGTGNSEENSIGYARSSQPASRGTRVSSTQSTSNLRIRSAFERNSQQSSRRHDSHGGYNLNSAIAARPTPIQYRRRSQASDQNANLSAIYSVGERYPALHPPTSIPAPRRSSGAQRQVIFPQRVSSQQYGVDNTRMDIPMPAGSSDDQRRSSTQSKSSTLFVPDVTNELRASSAAPSTNSRSTPNLFQSTSRAHLPHSRSSSASWDRHLPHRDTGYRVPSMVSAASGISGSSDGRAHRLGHMPFEESMLSRDSPLDELLLDFSRMFPEDGRPRSVGRSFTRPPGSPNRISLLSGDIFRQERSLEQTTSYSQDYNGIGRHPLKTANDSSFSEDDPVALSLALPSPNMPSSSPITTSSPHLNSATPMTSTISPRVSATQSSQSPSSLAQTQNATTPRVHVYDDRRSPRTQPQTPVDVSRSTRQTRTRATTMSRQEVGAVAGGLFSPVIPERRPHRPYTYPAGTPPSMIDGATMPGRPGIVGAQGARLNTRNDQRGSGASENDVEGNLAGLDADQRTWMGRREDGTLDVTPPREGRFERYLR